MMPNPKPGESRKDYMDRCMGDAKTREKYANPAQRAAVCNSMFKEAKEASVAQIMKIETVEALQYGRPGKNDVRKTPAKPSERRKGSKRNKPGSAKKPNENIKTSEGTEARLRSMMTEHNKKNKAVKQLWACSRLSSDVALVRLAEATLLKCPDQDGVLHE